MNRRQFLSFSAAGAISASAASAALGQNNSKPLKSQAARSNLYKSTDGLLELDLEANSRFISLGGSKANLLSYNGQVPAPR